MVTIEINGQKVEAEDNQMLIQAADKAGITIPRFCYHKHLSVAANCRMCLVEVEKAPKPMPACATPVAEGMVVHTKSTTALAAQKSVMEFLLINHPLDCPVCDQGGECDLQEMSVGYGGDASRYHEIKRVVKDKDIGPLVATELTRCIQCTRCIRFGDEIAGFPELGATGRGDWMEIGTYIEKSIDSELSGNIIDLCPVGALTAKPSRFTYRPWELTSNDSIAAHDCVGSNCNVQTINGQVKRVIARENETINDTWISDRDRFSYEAYNSEERLLKPLIKKQGEWQETDWEEALKFAVDGLKAIEEPSQLGALSSPSATTEELYLLQKLVRGIGSANIDHRLRQTDFSAQDADPVFPSLGIPVADLSSQQAVFLIGSNVRKEQPILAHQLRQSSLKGGRISLLNSVAYDYNFKLANELVTAPAQFFKEMKSLAKAAMEASSSDAPDGLAALVGSVKVSDKNKAVINDLTEADNALVILGTIAQSMPHYASMRMLASYIAASTGAKLGYLTPGANTSGACLAGVLPYRGVAGQALLADGGLNTHEMFSQGLKAYVLLGLEPELDIDNPAQVIQALKNADFVVSMTAFVSDTMKDTADVLLPVTPVVETSGTFINIDGTWQGFAAASQARGQSKPAWKVLRVMGNLFDIDGFDHQSSEDVVNELKAELKAELKTHTATIQQDNTPAWNCPENHSAQNSGLQRIAELSIYSVDAVTRRATALQQTTDADINYVRVNTALAKKLKLDDEQQVTVTQGGSANEKGSDNIGADMNLRIDDSITDNCVYLPAGLAAAATLGSGFDTIELTAKRMAK
jgi:NADH-quinone oxidoreductase subunit G